VRFPAATTAQTPGSLTAQDVTDCEAVPSISSVERAGSAGEPASEHLLDTVMRGLLDD
jgi:hypothetical protein